jgi:hypothetical protein
MTQKPQGPRHVCQDVELLDTYLQAIASAQESLRLLTESAANMFLSEQMHTDLRADAHYIDMARSELLRKRYDLVQARMAQPRPRSARDDLFTGQYANKTVQARVVGDETCG